MTPDTPEKVMNQVFSEQACFQRWLDIEASLARAQASVGMIPQEVADEISRKAKVELLDLNEFRRLFQQIAHPMVALLRLFRPLTEGNAGEYVHLGATTQDTMDTGTVLALKNAHEITYHSLRRIEDDLLTMAEKHADTIMVGRTHSVQALPITFGYKVAIWAREIRRHIQRLKECRERIFVAQLSGAVGTMAAFGQKGPEIMELFAKDLGLGVPDIAWHASRDRLAEFANLMAIIAATLWRIAQEVYLLMAAEVGEVCEPWQKGFVGSSTMPHKINPQISEQMISMARKVRYHASLITEVMVVDHERNLEHFVGERETLEELCRIMGSLLTYGENMAKNMTVYPERMRKNLDILQGVLLSEAVMIELGKIIGKQTAHEAVYEHAMKALQEGSSFRDLLLADSMINKHFTEADIDRMLEPEEYIGLAPRMARDMVALSRQQREKD